MRIISLWILCSLLGSPLLGSSPSGSRPSRTNKVEVVGAFSHIKHVGDHSYGYTLELWRQGNDLFGLFVSHTGQTGDLPIGLLEDLKFSSRTGKLSFRARLTTG